METQNNDDSWHWVDNYSVDQYILENTSWNTVQRGQIPEMIQVCDYDILIVLGELNTLV